MVGFRTSQFHVSVIRLGNVSSSIQGGKLWGHNRILQKMLQPRTSTSRKIRESVAKIRPELVPLFELVHKSDHHPPYEIDTPADAVKLSTFLHSKMLLSPELNRNSPCYIARRIIQLYIKLKYIATFPPYELDEYSSLGDQEYDEVRMVHCLLHNPQPSFDVEHIYRVAGMLGISYHGDSWNEVLKYVTSALPFAEHTESLLVRGSDDRSILDTSTKTNKYHTSTIPPVSPEQSWISRASCTASSIALDQYEVCERIRQELLLASLSINHDNIRDAFDRKMHNVRLRIAECLGLRGLHDNQAFQTIISPSGTDAEHFATSATLARLGVVHNASHPPGIVTNIVTAQGETGSGSVAACSGQHFSKLTPSGESAEVNTPLCSFPSDLVRCVQIPARQADGTINNADATATKIVQDCLNANPNNVALLHVVMGSKTGLSCPSFNAVDALLAKYPSRLLVVIDACQMRLDKGSLVEFVQRGYLVLVTGSKFFAGVPFCGCVLIPAQSVHEMNSADIAMCFPSGYRDYFTKYEFPPRTMANIRASLPSRMNIGLLLRWETALVNMEVYASIPPAMVEQISREYIERSKNMLATHAHVKLLDAFDASENRSRPKPPVSKNGLPIQPLDTIVSFSVFDSHRDELLSVNRLKVLHTLLAKDISSVLADTNPLEVTLASKKCLIGQPVSLGKLTHGVVRIALGADMVNHIFLGTKTMSELVLEDAIILRKIELILKHWDPLCARFVNTPQHPVAAEPSPLRQASSLWNFGAKSESYSSVVRAIIDKSLLVARTVLYDLDAIDMAFQTIAASFPPHFEHRFQVSACPLAFFLRRAIENDVGLTCTTIVEVQHALHLGCAPHKIVFNSPWKSRQEIAYAINAGVEVNADSFEELELIREHAQQRFQSNFPECTPRYAGELPRIGVRIHACLHKVDPKWTVGIPITKSNRALLIQAFVDNPWLSGLQAVCCPDCGVESVKQLTYGAQVICDLANEIDAIVGEDRVKVLNIGGHLPANFKSEQVSPTFADCVEMLRNDASKIFERNGRIVLTEFGQYISSKVGWTLSQIEHVRSCGTESTPTAVVHAGPDLFTKDSKNGSFLHRLTLYKSDGALSTGALQSQELVCFGGNHSVHIREIEAPLCEEGDLIVLHDTGSNANIRGLRFEQSSPVYGYRIQDENVKLVLLKAETAPEQLIQAWS